MNSAAAGRTRLPPVALALAAALLWGLSGSAAQLLFQRDGVAPATLTAVRMLVSGGLLYACLRPPPPRRHRWQLLLFSLFGLAAVQFTFFAAVEATGAATAMLLQFLYLPAVALWEGLTRRRLAAVVLALAGTLALIGGTGRLLVSDAGLAWALASAAAAAVYMLSSRRLVLEYGSWPVTTWGLLIGGLATLPALLAPGAWHIAPGASPVAVTALVAFVILCGTLLAFGLYLTSLGRIGATAAAVATTLEPLTAAVISTVALHAALTPTQYLGGALILAAIVWLGRPADPDRRRHSPDRTAA